MYGACDMCGNAFEECECEERRVVPDVVTMRGLPVFGLPGPLENGFHVISSLTDPVKGLELRPARVFVKDGKITQYGPASSSVPFWTDS